MTHFWNLLWDWNTLDSVRSIHSFLEGWALVFFALLVLFDVVAHFSEEHKARAKTLERIGLVCFAAAVLAEVFAYPYSRRNDTLASQQDTEQKGKIAALDNSTQGLKTDAENARKQAEAFKAQIADADARAKAAEAQVASAMAASEAASAKAEGFRLDIAKANESAERERLARLQLEARLADRHLTPDQRANLVRALQPFAGVRVNLFALSGDSEIIGLGNDLLSALAGNNSAGWMVTIGSGQDSAILSSGVLVELSPDASDREKRAAQIFINTLNGAGIVVHGPSSPTQGAIMGDTNRDPNANIRIVVAKKPS